MGGRLQLPNGPVGQQPQAVVDVAALQRPMVTPMNDVQVVAMIAASLDGNVEDRVSRSSPRGEEWRNLVGQHHWWNAP